MIRFACTQDFDAVVALWKRCFPGDDAFRDWFFANIYRAQTTLVDEEDGVLCAMTQLLPYQLRDVRGVRPVTYIYGACTAPEYRRQHHMDRLLRHSFALDMEQGRVASILIPQEEWLFDFYAAFGYQAAFYTRETIVMRDEGARTPAIRRLTEADIPQLDAAYLRGDMQLLRSYEQWREQLALFNTLGVGAFGCESNGALSYAFVWHDGPDQLYAQECIGPHTDALAQSVLQQQGCKRLRMMTWGESQRLGCIRYHDDTPVTDGYFNLLFN